jgi:hypothetical protein
VTNLATPWTPIVLLALLAALFHLPRERIAGWRLAALAVLGLAAVAASLALLRLSPDTAPLAFPWEPALGDSPHWAADPEMFPFAAVLLLLLTGIVLADRTRATRWPSAFLLVGGALAILFAENLLALALAWLLMETILRVVAADSAGAARHDTNTLDALWGFLGLAGILFLWHTTAGASLRAYATSEWTERARMILAAVALVRMGAYPLVSRRLAFGAARLSSVDACAAATVLAGLGLAQRAATLGPLPNPEWLSWLGAASALLCGFMAWQSASAHDRVQWALRAAIGLVVMLWGAEIVPPLLLFPGAAASIGLGLGLWTLRPSGQSSAGAIWRAVRVAAWIVPALVLGLGPFSPAAQGMLSLWQHLMDESMFLPLILGLAGQMFAMAALLRPDSAPEEADAGAAGQWAAHGFWLTAALAWTFWPRSILALAGDESGKIAAALLLPQSPGAWAALALPLMGALAQPEPARISRTGQMWAARTAALLSLGWLGTAALTAVDWIGRAIRGLDGLLGGDGYLPWTLVLLLGLVLWMAR